MHVVPLLVHAIPSSHFGSGNVPAGVGGIHTGDALVLAFLKHVRTLRKCVSVRMAEQTPMNCHRRQFDDSTLCADSTSRST